jgi:putative RNA methylase family UPF0020
MQSVLILGRQPELGIAEVESLYGAAAVRPVGDQAVMLDVDPCLLAFDRLGGAVKFCKLLTILDTVKWPEIEAFLRQAAPGQAATMPEGKMRLGLSVFGLEVTARRLEASGLTLKKAIRQTGRSVRLVPNKALSISTAQVIHNQLTRPTGWELVFIRDGHQTIVAQTVKVQDIAAYAQRDQARPKRDAKVGMLPPKLAQIIINLAVGPLPENQLASICDIPAGEHIPRPHLEQTLLDPFCGTGVVLQEALLMGYDAVGTDKESRMVEYAQANLAWLADRYQLDTSRLALTSGDATDFHWETTLDFVAAEAYLGRPFTARPDAETLATTVSDCNLIIKRFLQNLRPQLPAHVRLCLAVPAWQVRPGEFRHLPLIDRISDFGYNQVSFEHAGKPLIYHRADQIVARELIVLTIK